MREVAALAVGPGRISFADWVRLRLFDDAFWAGRDRASIAGAWRVNRLDRLANPLEWRGFRANRIAWNSFLAAHGFAVARIAAIFAPGVAAAGSSLLRNREALRAFLATNQTWPLVGGPIEGSAGAEPSVLTACHAGDGVLLAAGSVRLSLGAWIEHVCENHPAGYLFCLAPPAHRELAGLTDAPHVVRVTTAAHADGPRLLSAVWLVAERPGETLDPWSGGALAAKLDRRTGKVVRVSRGSGLDYVEVEGGSGLLARLADSGGLDWQRLKATAIEAARAIRSLKLISFDIAPSRDGPVIVDLTAPDLALDQFVERRGLLDGRLRASATERRLAA